MRGVIAMAGVRLSICIPAYNYGAFIAAAIESVLDQMRSGVEIVVLDGGSADQTQTVVERLAAKHPCLRYFRQPERGGIDRDLARSVELAAGEYCWLLSADDALQQGALRRMWEELDGGCDILLCNRVWCDENLKPVRPESWLSNGRVDRTVDFARAEDISRYLADARSLGALFSFMSCIGFRREAWLRANTDASFVGTNYAHVQRLFGMGREGARLRYVCEPLILCRGGTDSFRAGGLAARLLIDLRGFLELARAIFPEDEALRRSFLAVLKREHPWRRWVRARSATRDPDLWRDVERALAIYGFGPIRLRLISALGAVLALVRRRSGG